jgi:hypothetical protein
MPAAECPAPEKAASPAPATFATKGEVNKKREEEKREEEKRGCRLLECASQAPPGVRSQNAGQDDQAAKPSVKRN